MYSLNKNSNIVITRLRHDFAITSKWLYKNYMILNPGKCHFLNLGFNKSLPDFFFENTIVKNVTKEKILEKILNLIQKSKKSM